MDAHTKRRIAVQAECDPSSIDRYARGEIRRGTVYARITRALSQLGLDTQGRPLSAVPSNLAQSSLPGSKA